MLDDQLKDVYVKVSILQDTENPQHNDLCTFLNYANDRENKRFDLPDLVKLIALSYEKKYRTLRFNLVENYKYTFNELMSIVEAKKAYELDTWLKMKGMRIGQLESKVSISKKALYDIRKGYSSPKLENTIDICQALGISVYELKLPPRKTPPYKRQKA